MFQKPFIIEDGQFYYPKKPLHKQPLFWTTLVSGVLCFFLLCLVFLMGIAWGTEGFIEHTNGTPGVEDSQTYDSYGNPDFYTASVLGEKVEVEEGLDVTVTDMKESPTTELLTEEGTAIEVTVIVTNTGSDDYYLDEYEFVLYDRDNEDHVIDYRTYDVNLPEKVAAGETVTLKLIYGVEDTDGCGLAFQEYIWKESLGNSV